MSKCRTPVFVVTGGFDPSRGVEPQIITTPAGKSFRVEEVLGTLDLPDGVVQYICTINGKAEELLRRGDAWIALGEFASGSAAAAG